MFYKTPSYSRLTNRQYIAELILFKNWAILDITTSSALVQHTKLKYLFYRLPHDNITLWLVRWLGFRLMFASGVVKLTSGCPTWWGLTAMNWHYESQVVNI